LVTTSLKEGGEGETRVGKSSILSSLNQLTTLGQERTSKFSKVSSLN